MTELNDEVEFLLVCILVYKKLLEGTLLAHSILSKTLLTPMPYRDYQGFQNPQGSWVG